MNIKKNIISSIMKTFVFSLLVMVLLNGLNTFGYAQASQSIDGIYILIGDSDGTKVVKGATVTLTISGSPSGSLAMSAIKTDETVTDNGIFKIKNGKITLSFNEMEWAANNAPYSLSGNTLILPFKALGGSGSGTSTWKRLGGQEDSTGSTSTGKKKPGQDDGQGNNNDNKGNKKNGDDKGGNNKKDDNGDDDGSGTNPGKDDGKNPRPKPKDDPSKKPDQKPKQPGIKELVGNWTGRAAGEEVRFRANNGILILTVKHNAEFFFHVDENGNIDGEGTIEYDLERNTTGLDNLVAGVRGLMGLMPSAPGLPGSGAKAGLAGKMGDATTGAPGVTSLQYEAPHLKNGKEVRHFKFKGKAEMSTGYWDGEQKNNWKLTLEQDGDYTLPDGSADNKLIAQWEVNLVKEEKPFPCWSPFLKNPATLRKGPGGIWVAEFQEKGKGRNGVKVWQEYGYVWMARQNK